MDRLGLIIVTILTLISTRLNIGRANTLTTCTNVYSELSRLQFRYYTEIPQNPVNAQDLKVCRTGMSCCTASLERELINQAKLDFHTSLQTSTMFLKYTLATSAVDFRTEFEDLLQYGKERIQQHFRTLYTSIAIHMNSPIEDLFGSLMDYLHGMDVNVEHAVSRFFDTLFPHIYTSHINSKVTRLDSRYRDCLSNQASVIMPFGFAHRDLARILEKSLKVARMFLGTVNLGLEVLNSTENMPLTRRCTRALMQMRYCGQCQSLVGVPACQGFCFNVMKGCLANFMDLDLYWREYVAVVVDLVRVSMTAEYDLHSAMYTLDQKVMAAITRAIEDKDSIMQAAMITCGPPPLSRPSPYNDFAMNNPAGNIPIAPNPAIPLDELLLQFVGSLDSSKSVFRELPLLMCSQGNMASDSNRDCWTSETQGVYRKIVVEDGLAAQLHNPEVKLTSRERELLNALQLMDKLEHKTELIERFLRSTVEDAGMLPMPGSGDYYSGSGSEEFSGSGDLSGSGSGDGVENATLPQFSYTTVTPKETDFSFEPTSRGAGETRTKDPSGPTRRIPYRPATDPSVERTRRPDTQGAASSLHSVTLLLTSAMLCLSVFLHL
ncbi:glypican-5 precursor [Strongylocentrotus purpuratus]|uniref:Glypican-5 n=1 Tax=Strongylocentrotus purpuratus TaxID=7668 RepID=A0SVR1_STRPU|nr:glypican-5 precursor [Strongylocentrotus purpuratus]ABK58234.2 glypican-5 [Strongylocentrotus purpuratus]|eukprot:NP_001138966.1 glypican-5 precursor [Strongylocentrotus purpuratus]